MIREECWFASTLSIRSARVSFRFLFLSVVFSFIFMVLMLGSWQAAWLGVTRGSPNGRPQLFQHI